MEEDVLVAVDDDAGVLSSRGVAGVGPVGEVVRVGHADAVLLVEAPPLGGVVFVAEEVGVDHAAHRFARDSGAFDAEELRLAPVPEVGAAHGPDAGVLIAVSFAFRTRIGLEAEEPLWFCWRADLDYVAGGAVVEVLIAWSQGDGLGPVVEVFGFAPGEVGVGDAVSFGLDEGEVEIEPTLMVEGCGVAVGGGGVSAEENG